MKDKVIKLLIKWGGNEEEVLKKVDKYLNDALRTYPDARPAQIAEVITRFAYLF